LPKIKRFSAVVLLFLLVFPLFGKIRFSGLDLSEDNRLLFKADSSGGGAETQGALFLAQLPDPAATAEPLAAASGSVTQLSIFPEKMELLADGKFLLVHSAFGSQRIPAEGGIPKSFPGFPSFTGGSTPGGRVESTAASPDGRWLLYVEPQSYSTGTLILLDGESGKKIQVSTELERPGRLFPARWSGDSRGFLYTKGQKLYFYTINTQTVPPAERYRLIGEGAINSVYWGAGEFFYYMQGSTVYRIRSDELFARVLYRGFLDLGHVAGKVPFEFDPNFDNFWIAPDGLSMLLCKGGRNIFYYPLGINENTETDYASLPYVMAPRSSARINVLWSNGGIITVLISAAPGSGAGVLAYRLDTVAPKSSSFTVLESPPAFSAGLSPDGKRVVFWGRTGLFLYDYQSWKSLAVLLTSPVYSCIWQRNDELIAGGRERIERMRLTGTNTVSIAERNFLCLASVSRFGFEDSRQPGSGLRRILAYSGDSWYITDGTSPWVEYRSPSLREAVIVTDQYRVYLENSGGNSFFENLPMVRNIQSIGTFPLVEHRREAPDPPFGRNPSRLPDSESRFLFSHGVRNTRELSLCFDLYDDAAGLSTVLDVLNRFGIKATFFLNGEFIRRYPQGAREIAEAGHETASMFYAPLDLSDSRYQIDSTFIARGLARNEDEFFKATGKELSLFWHPPYYAVSREIADAASAAGYKTTGRDIDSRDWVLSGDARRLGIAQLSAADMIDHIMDAKEGGSIIPIRLGLLPGGRGDYLFNNLEVLLEALMREGYEIVPVSTLINKSR
jgi:peptidoglycan/xylan/chitin deacetylase (PgdA/CDA1 family)